MKVTEHSPHPAGHQKGNTAEAWLQISCRELQECLPHCVQAGGRKCNGFEVESRSVPTVGSRLCPLFFQLSTDWRRASPWAWNIPSHLFSLELLDCWLPCLEQICSFRQWLSMSNLPLERIFFTFSRRDSEILFSYIAI